VQGEAHLFEIVFALAVASSLADFLDRGSSIPIRMPMMAITTNSSISVKAGRRTSRFITPPPRGNETKK
jgi:hypothetical protein